MSVKARIEQARAEAKQIDSQLRNEVETRRDVSLSQACSDVPQLQAPSLQAKRTLKGHQGKIYSMHWAEEGYSLVSAAQDGVLIVWDGLTTNKIHGIPLRCTWVMTCAFAPSGNIVACGGLDNICSIYNLSDVQNPARELTGHNGHLSSCRFLNNARILTSSGDQTCVLWDIETGKPLNKFTDHDGDVLSVSLSSDQSTFVSGSTDATAKIFDIREARIAQMSFLSHHEDVNSVQFFPNDQAFGTGSEDKTCKIFDIRYAGDLATYESDTGATSVAFSKTGKLFFSSYSFNGNVKVWDTLKGAKISELKAHKENPVSSIGVSGDGRALCTASWDKTLKIFA